VFQPTTFSKYFLTRRIAVGGMAEVFAAKLYGADGFEKDLVIKQILPQHAKDPEFVQSFIAEAKIAVSLNHANIVGIYELGRVEGTYFIAMEYVDGLDVFQAIDLARRFGDSIPPGLALLIVEEVSKGLDYAHRKTGPDGQPLGLVHRDLNPRNVLISREGEVKILDFGIAKTASKVAAMPKTRAGVVKGTTGYMSPEQAVGMEVDARTDIYQTGLLLHELLTGSALFWRPDEDETRDRMRRHQVRPPSEANPEVPDELDRLVLRLLDKRPERRTQTAAEVAQQAGRVRFLYYPDQDHRTLGHLVQRLLEEKLRQESQAEAIPVSLPNTLELSEVISQAIEHTISEDIETIATRFPADPSDREPGSAPLLVKSDHSVEETPAFGTARPDGLPRPPQPPRSPTPVPPPPAPVSPLAPQPADADTTLPEPEPEADGTPSLVAAPHPPWWRRRPVQAASGAVLLVAGWLWLASGERAEPASPPSARSNSGDRAKAPSDAIADRTSSAPTEDRTREAPAEPEVPGPAPATPAASGETARSEDRTFERAPSPNNHAVVAFGTRSCSSRVSVNGQVVTRSTPSYDHRIQPGRKRVVIEGTSCPPRERPGSLRRSIPVVVSEVTFEPNSRVKVIADFRKDRLIVKTQ
jgi:eukaryotic-like serine/threonine-protein kinase